MQSLQDIYLLLVGCAVVILGRNIAGEGTTGIREGEVADQHKKNANYLFDEGVRTDVAVADRRDGSNGEVE